jgi:hypothetical protein
MIGTSRQYVNRLSREDPHFPEPEVVLKSGRVWSRDAIEAWAQATLRPIDARGQHDAVPVELPSGEWVALLHRVRQGRRHWAGAQLRDAGAAARRKPPRRLSSLAALRNPRVPRPKAAAHAPDKPRQNHQRPLTSCQGPFHAGGWRQWSAWSCTEYTIRKDRPGFGLNAVMGSPGPGHRGHVGATVDLGRVTRNGG